MKLISQALLLALALVCFYVPELNDKYSQLELTIFQATGVIIAAIQINQLKDN